MTQQDHRDSLLSSIYQLQPQYQHKEEHIQSGQYLKSSIYGGLDGVVNTLTVILGGIGSGSSAYAILAVGISVLFSDGMGMGLGDYLSSKAQNQFISAEQKRQLWEVENKLDAEKQQVVDIYTDKGYSQQQSRRIADLYSTNSKAFVNIMMLQQLGLVANDSSPFWNGVVTLFAFVLFGFLPLIPYVIGAGIAGSKDQYLLISLILGAIQLFSLGFAKAILIGLNKWKSGLQTLIFGGLAVAVGFGIGVIFQVKEDNISNLAM